MSYQLYTGEWLKKKNFILEKFEMEICKLQLNYIQYIFNWAM